MTFQLHFLSIAQRAFNDLLLNVQVANFHTSTQHWWTIQAYYSVKLIQYVGGMQCRQCIAPIKKFKKWTMPEKCRVTSRQMALARNVEVLLVFYRWLYSCLSKSFLKLISSAAIQLQYVKSTSKSILGNSFFFVFCTDHGIHI